MNYTAFLVSDPAILLGKPVVKGTRISVAFILKRLSEGATYMDLMEAYPVLNLEAIYAVLAYAADVVRNEAIID